MIKDLSEAIYYCTITDAMEKADEAKDKEVPVNNITYYTTPAATMPAIAPVYDKTYPDYYRDMERNNGYMYYPSGSAGGNSGGRSGGNTGGNSSGTRSGSTSYYTEYPEMPYIDRDPREGKAAMRRRMYMEGKEMHNDKNSQLRELEAYMKELSDDITEMIKDSSPEEKATLHQNMTMLANKII